jgi:hypothetical protein
MRSWGLSRTTRDSPPGLGQLTYRVPEEDLAVRVGDRVRVDEGEVSKAQGGQSQATKFPRAGPTTWFSVFCFGFRYWGDGLGYAEALSPFTVG